MSNFPQNPDDTLNPEGEDTEDQQSQQDVHSDGLEPRPEDLKPDNTPDVEGVEAAAKAAEAAYTLFLGEDKPPKKPEGW